MINIKNKLQTILQVLPALNSGGVERGCIDVGIFLAQRGYRSLIASQGGRLSIGMERRGIEHITLPLQAKMPWAILLNAYKLSNLIQQEHVQLVHVRSRAPAWSVFWASQRTSFPWVTTFHGTYNFTNRFKHYYNSVMTRSDHIIAPSHFIGRHLEEHYGVTPDRYTVIPRGIDLQTFSLNTITTERRLRLLQQWNLPDNGPIILMPGRLSRWKGQALVLEALAHLKDLNYLCVFVGNSGKKEAYLEELIAQTTALNLGDKVRFVGDCDDMTMAYSLSDIVLSASLDPEAFGRVVGEGMAMERVVIAPDHGGGAELIDSGKTGFLFEPGNATALADTLQKALALSPEAKIMMRKRAREKVAKYCTLDQMLQKTEEVYARVWEAWCQRKS